MTIENQMKVEELKSDMYRALRKIDPSDEYTLKQVLPSMQEYMSALASIAVAEGA